MCVVLSSRSRVAETGGFRRVIDRPPPSLSYLSYLICVAALLRVGWGGKSRNRAEGERKNVKESELAKDIVSST